MPRKVSEIQKKEMLTDLMDGKTLDELARKFNFTKLTITKNLKKIIGEADFQKHIEANNNKINNKVSNNDLISKSELKDFELEGNSIQKNAQFEESFIEIAPLNFEIDNATQKDFSSIPISEIKFPKIGYMIVDKKIELETKTLNDYPQWQFLSKNELMRKTIEIFFDLKIAKRFCTSDQKVIKVPNTEVFKIVAPNLLSRGISRIVSPDQLIAL